MRYSNYNCTALGFNQVELAAAVGSIIARVVSPGSELYTHDWLQSCSALGESFDHDYGNTSLTRFYNISDKLLKHQTALETFLSGQEQTLFDLNRSIVLYDLTTTTLSTDDHKTIHLRTTTKAEGRQKQIYDALNIKPDLIGKYKTMIDKKKSVVATESN